MTHDIPIRGLLFDKDGTLFDFHRSWTSVFDEAARRLAHDDETLTQVLMAAGGYDAFYSTVYLAWR